MADQVAPRRETGLPRGRQADFCPIPHPKGVRMAVGDTGMLRLPDDGSAHNARLDAPARDRQRGGRTAEMIQNGLTAGRSKASAALLAEMWAKASKTSK